MGVGLALITGWTAFPRALYVRQEQPLEFQHKMHSAKSGALNGMWRLLGRGAGAGRHESDILAHPYRH
jgi:hypothetical protein